MKAIISLLSLTLLANCANLPSYFTKCSKSDPELNSCILKSITKAWPMLINGDKNIHVQKLAPIEVPFVSVYVSKDLQGNLSNAYISGLESTEFENVRFDLEKKRFESNFTQEKLNVQAKYEIAGRLLFLPIRGEGPANVTFVNMKNQFYFEYDLNEKDRKTYIQIKNNQIKYTTSRGHFRLDNLFDGDERLGAEMNKVLDENWEAVNEEVGTAIANAVATIYSKILQQFFNKVPFNELFDE